MRIGLRRACRGGGRGENQGESACEFHGVIPFALAEDFGRGAIDLGQSHRDGEKPGPDSKLAMLIDLKTYQHK